MSVIRKKGFILKKETDFSASSLAKEQRMRWVLLALFIVFIFFICLVGYVADPFGVWLRRDRRFIRGAAPSLVFSGEEEKLGAGG